MSRPADHSWAIRPSTDRERWARWAPVSSKDTSLAGRAVKAAHAARKTSRLAIGLRIPPKNNRIRLNLMSLSPMEASSPTCSAAVGRGRSLWVPRCPAAPLWERTLAPKRLLVWLLPTCYLSTVGRRLLTLTRPLVCDTDTLGGHVLLGIAATTR